MNKPVQNQYVKLAANDIKIGDLNAPPSFVGNVSDLSAYLETVRLNHLADKGMNQGKNDIKIENFKQIDTPVITKNDNEDLIINDNHFTDIKMAASGARIVGTMRKTRAPNRR